MAVPAGRRWLRRIASRYKPGINRLEFSAAMWAILNKTTGNWSEGGENTTSSLLSHLHQNVLEHLRRAPSLLSLCYLPTAIWLFLVQRFLVDPVPTEKASHTLFLHVLFHLRAFFFFLSLKEGEFAFIRKVFSLAYSESRMSLSSVSLFLDSLLSFPLLFLASHPNTEGLMGSDNLQKLVSVASCFCSKGWCPVCRQLVPRPQPTGRKWGCYGAALGGAQTLGGATSVRLRQD